MFRAADLPKVIENSQFLLLLLEEEVCMDRVEEIVKSIDKTNNICYICLSRPYEDIYSDMKNRDIDLSRFHFLDVLSSHYIEMQSNENCTFINSPANLPVIRSEISKAIRDKKCRVVVFDSITAMLEYQGTSKIVRFTHDLLSGERQENKILYLVLKHGIIPVEENEKLVKDLVMFADMAIDLNSAANNKSIEY
ncbi:MAG: hypothetical protein JXC85_05060 [Candidatus Aenigmarchaeota archaeon]|nr:hypothetical protein [Candidatus Aenigmarchaeota archaeon]